MDILRTVSDDYDMNQRICFNIIQVKKNFFCFSIKIFFFNFRKLFQYQNAILLIGNYAFVLNWLLHLQVVIFSKMLFKIILIEILIILK